MSIRFNQPPWLFCAPHRRRLEVPKLYIYMFLRYFTRGLDGGLETRLSHSCNMPDIYSSIVLNDWRKTYWQELGVLYTRHYHCGKGWTSDVSPLVESAPRTAHGEWHYNFLLCDIAAVQTRAYSYVLGIIFASLTHVWYAGQLSPIVLVSTPSTQANNDNDHSSNLTWWHYWHVFVSSILQ